MAQQGQAFLLESRYSLTFRARGWGSPYAWCGVAVISFTSGKLWEFTRHCTRHLDIADYLIFTITLKQVKDFRSKMQSIFPAIPGNSFFFKFLSAVGVRVLITAHRTFSCSMWDLVPWPGMESGPPALEAQSFSHWTAREVSLKNSWIDWWVGGSIEMQMRWAWWIKSRTTVMGRAVFGEATTAEGLNWFLLRNTCRLLSDLWDRWHSVSSQEANSHFCVVYFTADLVMCARARACVCVCVCVCVGGRAKSSQS